MTHNHVASIATEGLQDGCRRCGQIAGDPFRQLDDDNLRALVDRTRGWMYDREDCFPRTVTEEYAMRAVESFFRKLERFARLERTVPPS